MFWSSPPLWGLLLIYLQTTRAYIPATAVNDTSQLVTSDDQITIVWPSGLFSSKISRQLKQDSFDDSGNYTSISPILPWTKYSKGVLVNFNESYAGDTPSVVPWIAMINCDANVTDYSETNDVFTMARDLGAQAALLFTLTHEACVLNPEYLSFAQPVLDVYATTTQQNTRLLVNQFMFVAPTSYDYNPANLNESSVAIENLLNTSSLFVVGNTPDPNYQANLNAAAAAAAASILGMPVLSSSTVGTPTTSTSTSASDDSGQVTNIPRRQKRFIAPRSAPEVPLPTSTGPIANYLAAVMAASNMTVGPMASVSSPTPTITPSNNNGGPNTGLAMIILYAITGVVTFMFLVVILSGAVRAIRHPDRYGPRAGGGHNRTGSGGSGVGGQTRAHGLTRAILDTFPVVKFGRGGTGPVSGERGIGENEDTPFEDLSPVEQARRRNMRTSQYGEMGVNNGGYAGKGIELDAMTSTTVRPVILPSVLAGGAVGGGGIQQEVTSRGSSRSSFVSAVDEVVVPSTPSGEIASSSPPSEPRHGVHEQSVPITSPLTINPVDVDDSMTCPICVCEFEDGDDLRILPCDARHRFHRDCIDPWLLDVSSLCPLCRLDLAAGSGVIPNGRRSGRRTSDESGASDGRGSSLVGGGGVIGSGLGGGGGESDENDAIGEQQVISNLRAMLQGRNRSSTTSGAQSVAIAPGVGGDERTRETNGLSTLANRNRFFRYVANRRQRAVRGLRQEGEVLTE